MQATTHLWREHANAKTSLSSISSKHVDVVFTTESTSMVQEQQVFVKQQKQQQQQQQESSGNDFVFHFVTNHLDVTPDSGFIKHVDTTPTSFTADESMLSAVTSLKFQLLPAVSLGDCCSNFHVLLKYFLMEGLGAAFFGKRPSSACKSLTIRNSLSVADGNTHASNGEPRPWRISPTQQP